MDWLENKYVNMLSGRLRNFRRKSSRIVNFSCPICGDSESDRKKARGYIYEKKGKALYHCHNCTVTMDVPRFIKTLDGNLYKEFTLEKLKGNKSPEQIDLESFVDKMKKPVFMTGGILKGLKKVSQLRPDHPAKQLVDSRKIPTQYHSKLFLCPNFKTHTNNFVPNKFANTDKDETRLLIPFIDSEKNVHAFQGRAIRDYGPRYITIVLDETKPKVYGLDTVNVNNKVYVFEGPIDSMFIPNSIATAGGDLISALSGFNCNKSNLVIVYDNEPRNKDTIKKIDKAILNGYNVCIWPENLDYKDVNDMILGGLSSEFIKHIIDTHTYNDLAARLTLTKWRKV
jgi:transcription elongation factor Elf1